MTFKNTNNVSHDLLPIIRDISDQLSLIRNVKSAIDLIKLLDATENNVFLVEQYLLNLAKESQNSIENL